MVVTGLAEKKIDIPEDVEVELSDGKVIIRRGETLLAKRLSHARVEIKVVGSTVHISCSLPTKKEKALVGTFASHISNLIRGVTEGFTYTMKLVYAHFPVKVSVRGDHVLIENFLGERHPRTAQVRGDVKVDVKGDTLRISGANLEEVSQTAANIEQATRIKNKDPRVFQDGIYIVSKGGM
ncbi:MAG: 50S ribosomal protein L6 [Thermoplasmata archaeon]